LGSAKITVARGSIPTTADLHNRAIGRLVAVTLGTLLGAEVVAVSFAGAEYRPPELIRQESLRKFSDNSEASLRAAVEKIAFAKAVESCRNKATEKTMIADLNSIEEESRML
jgi:hypothetical protein